MLVGPFDRRKKRSRCQECSSSHLKCSGQTPCSNCERRHLTCTYGPTQNGKPIILVDRGQQKTISNWTTPSHKRKRKTPLVATMVVLPSPSRLTDDSLCFLNYFDIFVQSNSFTGKERTLGDEVKQLAGLHSGSYLMNAMLSLGAIQAVKLKATDIPSRKECLASALEHYSKSIIGLRDAINAHEKSEEQIRNVVLWTTLFLGLFELINDETGNGWQQHMIHGTARALEASGPTSCRSGPSRKFFVQARVFEVSRSILFNESTFLTHPEWVDLSRHMWIGEDGGEWRPLDSLLDIMMMISHLRVRASSFIDAQEESPDTEPTAEAQSIHADGFALREALHAWYTSYAKPNDTPNIPTVGEDDSMILARVFFAAISIYLSGVFDYEIIHWHRLGLVPPTLDEQTIQMHTNTILHLCTMALDTTSLSSLLLLFPLRIAGARSRKQWQRDWVARLLDKIGRGFAVAAAITMDLSDVWEMFSVDTTDERATLQQTAYIHT